MAKEIHPNHARLVYQGTDSAPASVMMEYVCRDGEMVGEPGRKEFASPDFGQTMSALWQSSVATVEAQEGI